MYVKLLNSHCEAKLFIKKIFEAHCPFKKTRLDFDIPFKNCVKEKFLISRVCQHFNISHISE